MIKDMHDEYKRWLREQYNSDRKPMSQPEFRADMENRLGPAKPRKGWTGVRFYNNPAVNEEMEEESKEEKSEVKQMKQKKKIDL